MSLTRPQQEFLILVSTIAQTFNQYLAANESYESKATLETRDALSKAGQDFEATWKVLSAAHSRLNQSNRYRFDLFGHR